MEPTLPTTSEFYLDGEPHISPARLIAEFCAAEGVTGEELGVRPTVVVTFGTRLTQFLADNAGARRTDRRLPISWGELHSSDVLCLVRLSIGAPAAVAACEELIALGASTFIVVAASGEPQARLPIGSVILPERAIREEGTSTTTCRPKIPHWQQQSRRQAGASLPAARTEPRARAALDNRRDLPRTPPEDRALRRARSTVR